MDNEKILIIGCSGSGKSTFAKKLHTITKLPLIHLDKLYYKPNWKKPEKSEWEHQLEALCKCDRWIIDGNYINTLALRATYADTIIYLNKSRWTCLFYAIYRVYASSKDNRTDMAAGCAEKLDFKLYRFIWNFKKMVHPRIVALLKQFQPEKQIYVLNTKREIEAFLNSCSLKNTVI